MRLARPMVFGRQRHDRPRSLGHAIDLDKTGTEDRHRLVEQGGRDRARTVEDMVKAAEVGGFRPRMVEEDPESGRNEKELLDAAAFDLIENKVRDRKSTRLNSSH